jgi:hypothetical protein
MSDAARLFKVVYPMVTHFMRAKLGVSPESGS